MSKTLWRSLKPVVIENTLDRPRLNEKLDQEARAYWISAPAGYGKSLSTLRWLKAREKHYLWMSCRDNASQNLQSIHEAMKAKYAVLSSQNSIIYGVIDNAERLQEEELLAQLPLWIEDSNYQLRLIVISRRPFPLAAGSLLLQDGLVVIHSTDLCFSEAEWPPSNFRMTKRDAWRLSLGWAVFLNYFEQAREIDESLSLIDEYIEQEVWPYLPNEFQKSLQLMVGLGKASKALMNAVLPEIGSIRLQSLKAYGLILTAEEHTWYQAHPLIKHYLENRPEICLSSEQLNPSSPLPR